MIICFRRRRQKREEEEEEVRAEGEEEEEVIAGFTQSADSWAIREWALATSTGQVGTTG